MPKYDQTHKEFVSDAEPLSILAKQQNSDNHHHNINKKGGVKNIIMINNIATVILHG